MANKKIRITIGCKNIAPLENLHKDIFTGSLKICVFANNGSGKTFLSRLFRLLEPSDSNLKLETNRSSPTDSFIRFGSKSGSFLFKITDKKEKELENIFLKIDDKKIPKIPITNYIYHTFNQDYVEDNLRELNFEKNSDIHGYILGKTQIDLTEDKNKLQKIQNDGSELKSKIESSVNEYLIKKIDTIRDIRRLQEYKINLNTDKIINSTKDSKYKISKSVDELLSDFNKIKSIPDNIEKIQEIDKLALDINSLPLIIKNLNKSFTLSSFAKDFKEAIKNKQAFIEEGVKIYSENKVICPFCEQELKKDAISLIDRYTKYLNDIEAQTIKNFESQKAKLEVFLKIISDIVATNLNRINLFETYKNRYIPTLENVFLEPICTKDLKQNIQLIIDGIKEKIKAINNKITIECDTSEKIENLVSDINTKLSNNNDKIKSLNSKIDTIGFESKAIRKNICKAAYNFLISINEQNLANIKKLRTDYKDLRADIVKREEAEKVSKKKMVYETIKEVLNYFFSGKYTLDENNFHLKFNQRLLNEGQAKQVLSEGEKNIVAFAYFLGDTHLKIKEENDYNKIFFIIDDPISSMDYNYVYRLSGVIRNIKNIFKYINRDKFLLFTHNNDFMRILCSNNIVEKKLLLHNGELDDFNENYTVPYISHLIDIYKIARNGEKANHTTANSIRHIIETLTKFQNIEVSTDSISEYIGKYMPKDKQSYTFINDLSHGGWRSEQCPMTDDDYKEVCQTIITHIEGVYPNQIKYCNKFV